MLLLGSKASPFVRRVRLLLGGTSYEFRAIDIFSKEGHEEVVRHTPTGRIPVLIDDDNTIFDSLLICRHLLRKLGKPELAMADERALVLINEASDSAVILFQLRKFEVTSDEKNPFVVAQRRRVERVLKHFDTLAEQGTIPWELTGMWLYAMLDWFSFRQIYSWEQKFGALQRWFEAQSDNAFVAATDPRQ